MGVACGGRRQKGIGMDTSIIQVAGNQAVLWAEITPMAPSIHTHIHMCAKVGGAKMLHTARRPKHSQHFS